MLSRVCYVGGNRMSKKRSNIYKRIFWINSIILIFAIILLDVYFINKLVKDSKEYEFYINEKVLYDVNEELGNAYNHSLEVISEIYEDKLLFNDVIRFLNMDTITYLEHKLDYLSTTKDSYYNGIKNFIKKSFNFNENLKEITFVSLKRNIKSTFNKLTQITTEEAYIDEFYADGYLRKYISGNNSLSFVKEINNTLDLNLEGIIILTYDFKYLENIKSRYGNNRRVLILDNLGYVVYDSNNVFGYEPYPYYRKLMDNDSNKITLDKDYYISKSIHDDNICIVSMINRLNFEQFYNSITLLALFTIICLLIAQGVFYIKLKAVGNRTDNILDAMDKVKQGNLNIKIPLTSHTDEINYISDNFNQMCKELNKYIDKSYKAELDQKKAEMVALQNQINPHFLYNTLESIRMKAICNNDKEVGHMLYILSTLFRKQLKDKSIVTLETELDYCKKYIEIFKFRYYDTFKFSIDCPDPLKNIEIPKFSLQPIVENYFVHGIRLSDNDNFIKIKLALNDGEVWIDIIDNGYGIDEEKRKTLNQKLKHQVYEGDSLGIINVHRRIVLEYSELYGISLITNDRKENVIRIKLPCKGV